VEVNAITASSPSSYTALLLLLLLVPNTLIHSSGRSDVRCQSRSDYIPMVCSLTKKLSAEDEQDHQI
jgi:hypothetical protein